MLLAEYRKYEISRHRGYRSACPRHLCRNDTRGMVLAGYLNRTFPEGGKLHTAYGRLVGLLCVALFGAAGWFGADSAGLISHREETANLLPKPVGLWARVKSASQRP